MGLFFIYEAHQSLGRTEAKHEPNHLFFLKSLILTLNVVRMKHT